MSRFSLPPLRTFKPRPHSPEQFPGTVSTNPSGLDCLHPTNKDLVVYALQRLAELQLKVSEEGFIREDEVVRSSVKQALEKAIEDLVLAWLDSRGFDSPVPGNKFLSLMDILLESVTFTFTSDKNVNDVDDRLKSYYTKAEYRNLAHTLRITPVGAVRSATQNRLIEILDTLSK